MILTTTYKKIFAVIVLLLVGLVVWAQDPFTVVVGSTHLYRVTQNDDNNKYIWEVYTDEACSPANKVGESATTYDLIGTGCTVNIKWLSAGTFYLLLTERNHIGDGDCENYTQKKITVKEANMQIGFANADKYYCADEDRDSVHVKLTFMPILHPSKHYPLEVTYECCFDGQIKTVTKKINEDNILIVEYDSLNSFREKLDKDNYQKLEFVKVIDKYGAEISTSGIIEYTWGTYVKPPITRINNK